MKYNKFESVQNFHSKNINNLLSTFCIYVSTLLAASNAHAQEPYDISIDENNKLVEYYDVNPFKASNELRGSLDFFAQNKTSTNRLSILPGVYTYGQPSIAWLVSGFYNLSSVNNSVFDLMAASLSIRGKHDYGTAISVDSSMFFKVYKDFNLAFYLGLYSFDSDIEDFYSRRIVDVNSAYFFPELNWNSENLFAFLSFYRSGFRYNLSEDYLFAECGWNDYYCKAGYFTNSTHNFGNRAVEEDKYSFGAVLMIDEDAVFQFTLHFGVNFK